MKSLLARCMNKPVQVASSEIFGDAKPRICELVGLESVGVWLANEELTKLVYGAGAKGASAVFVPLSQVTYLVAGATPRARAPGAAAPARANTRSRTTEK